MMHGLPKVFITPDDHKQLQQVVRSTYDKRWRTAQFLDAEIRRAEIHAPLASSDVAFKTVGIGDLPLYNEDLEVTKPPFCHGSDFGPRFVPPMQCYLLPLNTIAPFPLR